MGKILISRSNYRHAIENLEIAKKLVDFDNRSTLDLHYSLSLCYENEKDYASSLEELRIIYDIDPEYKDVSEKLISDNYKNLNLSYLMDFENFSTDKFLNYSMKLLNYFNLKIIRYEIIDKNSILAFETRVNKIGFFYKILQSYVNYSNSEKMLILIIRSVSVRENLIEEILDKVTIKANKGILMSSSQISPLALNFAHEKKLKVIIPSLLNRIVKELPY